MIDAYTHLDMSTRDPIDDLRLRMDSAKIDRALIVETWGRDNHSCLERLIAQSPTQFRVAVCFRAEEKRPYLDILQETTVVALRIKTADIQHLGSLAGSLESSGKWLLTHAEAGIKELKNKLVPLAKLHPHLHIYLPHFGWPRNDKLDDKDWGDSVRELSRLPNVIMGISAIDHFSNEPYPHRDIEPFATRLLDAFGPDSVVIGSDYPLFEKDMYARYIDLAQQWVQRTSTRWTCRFEFDPFGNTVPSIRETGPSV